MKYAFPAFIAVLVGYVVVLVGFEVESYRYESWKESHTIPRTVQFQIQGLPPCPTPQAWQHSQTGNVVKFWCG